MTKEKIRTKSIWFHNAIEGESFEEAFALTESIYETVKKLASLEKQKLIRVVDTDSSPSVMFFENDPSVENIVKNLDWVNEEPDEEDFDNPDWEGWVKDDEETEE